MLDATFHRVALQTMMSSLAYSRGTAYLLEAKSATCHVHQRDNNCVRDTMPGLDAVTTPLIRHTCTKPPKAGELYAAGVDAHWFLGAALSLVRNAFLYCQG